MHYPIQLYSFTKQKNEILIKIADPKLLSPEKFIFDKTYKISNKRIIDIDHQTHSRRTVKIFKDFDNCTYASIRNYDIDLSSKLAIPKFINCNFRCIVCNKNYDKNIKIKCCNMNSPILIYSAELAGIYIPTMEQSNDATKYSKNLFMELHFPDLLDNIMIR